MSSPYLSSKREHIQTSKLKGQKLRKKDHAQRVNEIFRKRRSTIFQKLYKLRQCETDAYLVLRRKGKYYIYTSCRHSVWPPRPEEIVRSALSFTNYLADPIGNVLPTTGYQDTGRFRSSGEVRVWSRGSPRTTTYSMQVE